MRSKLLYHLKFLLVCSAGLTIFTLPALTATKPNSNKPAGGAVVVKASPKWSMQSGPASNLKILTPNKQPVFLNDTLNMVVLEEGKIAVYKYSNETQWEKTQTLEVPEVLFTTFLVKDLNNDLVPEIIAGTTEPGFIYVFSLDSNQQWVSQNEAKYIWSDITQLTVVKIDANQPTTKPGAVSTVKNSTGKLPYVVVQNKEGFLFVLKVSETALDLSWKSPKALKAIGSVVALDLDNDANDELIVVYKSGEVSVLTNVKNAFSSTWQHFPWGKVLAVDFNDWDHDNSPELILTTTQKMVYVIKPNKKAYTVSQQVFDYVIEKMHFTKVQNRNLLFTADTSGKVHLLEYSAKAAAWKEVQSFQTGRVLDFINKAPNELILVNQALQTFVIQCTE